MFSDKIWETRKSRIYAEQRLLSLNSISYLLIVWYSSVLVFFTIWNLKFPDEQLNILLVFGSIAVLVTSVVVTSQKYIERSLAMRNCYIKLDELYSKVKRAEEKKDIHVLQNLEAEYSIIIENVENHSDYDYLCLRYSLRNNKETTLPNLSKIDYIQYYSGKTLRILLVLIYIVLPFAIAYLWGLLI